MQDYIAALLAKERRGWLSDGRLLSSKVGATNRRVLIGWMMTVAEHFKLKTGTYQQAVNLLEACLSRDASIDLTGLQLTGCVCLMLASKYQELCPTEVGDFIFVSQKCFTEEQFWEREGEVYQLLGCNVNIANEEQFLSVLQPDFDSLARRLGSKLLQLMTLKYCQFLPSVMATVVHQVCSNLCDIPYRNYFNIPDEVVARCRNKLIDRISRLKEIDSHKPKLVSLEAWRSTIAAIRRLKKQDLAQDKGGMECYTTAGMECYTTAGMECYTKDKYFRPHLGLDLVDMEFLPVLPTYLGKGTYGVVRKHAYQNKDYAVKEIQSEETLGLDRAFVREVSTLLSLDHPGIMKVRYVTTNLRGIFMDLGVSDLAGWLKDRAPLNKSEQQLLATQSLEALVYLHGAGYLHLDLKPQNIIVCSYNPQQLTFQLADFGTSRGPHAVLEQNIYDTPELTTLWYRTPHALLGSSCYGAESDVWGLLCTLYQAAVGRPLFAGSCERNQLLKIFEILGTPDEETNWPDARLLPKWKDGFPRRPTKTDYFTRQPLLSPAYVRLLNQGLVMDPNTRPSSARLLELL